MMLEEVSCCCCYTAESAYTLSKDDDHYILRCNANSRGLLCTHGTTPVLVKLPFQPPEQKGLNHFKNDLIMHKKLGRI